MIQFADMNEDPSRFMLLTTLWFTDTTMVDGTPFTPEPEVHMVTWTDELRQRAELAHRINAHNEWASEQDGSGSMSSAWG